MSEDRTLVAIPVVGGPEDGATHYVGKDRLDDYEVAALHDVDGRPVATDELYVVRWQYTNPEAPDPSGRWVAVHSELISEDLEAHRQNREPENPDDVPSLGVHYCSDGHDWAEWRQTPKGNRVRTCRKCPLSQGSVI